jgi:NADH-quinone oxidoreductase subunit E
MDASVGAKEPFAFSADNEPKAAALIRKYPQGKQASAVLPLLTLAQEQCGGWLPQPALDHVAEFLGMPRIRVYEVASFYDMYNTEPVGRAQIRVCTTTPCWLCGSDDVVRACRDVLGIGIGESTPDMRFFLREFECLGACANAPMMWIDDDFYEDLTYDSTKAILETLMRGERPKPGSQTGRRGSMPAGGKTTLLEDPHDQDPKRQDGPGQRDEEPIEKAKPDVEVHSQAVKVAIEGRPAEAAGDRAEPESKDPDAR